MHGFLFIFLFISFYFISSAQDLVVINGGVFGTSEYANFTSQSLTGGNLSAIDTIYTNSIQDVVIDGQFAFVAAQDSIIKYDLTNMSRVSSVAFGAESTIKLAVSNGYVLAGNWYAPWGAVGPYPNHFRVFNSTDLSFVDSIPAISKPAKDFVVHNNYAYIAQNNAQTAGFGDTLGYLAVVDLTNMSLVRMDTLSNNGDEIGRMILEGDVIYTLNGVSNTISSYDLTNQTFSTQATSVDLKPKSYGPTAFNASSGVWYIPFDNGVGTYDLANNAVVNADIVTISGSFAFTLDTFNNRIAVSHIDYLNQNNNQGVYYNMTGDSVASFIVGFSPEAMAVVSSIVGSVNAFASQQEVPYKLYPNPVSDFLTIDIQSNGFFSAAIYHINGQRVWEATELNATSVVSVESLTAGVYTFVLKNKDGSLYTQRFIKQ